MRHQKHRYRLGRPSAARKALIRNLSLALLTHERIVTTLPKAKALKREVEPLITLGKKGDLAARRRALQLLPNKKIIQKLFNEIAPQYAERNGGYTRIMKLTPRHGDAAPMAIIELVGYSEKLQAEEEVTTGTKKKSKGIRQRLKDKVSKGAKKDAAPAVEEIAVAEEVIEAVVEESVESEEVTAEEETEEVSAEAPVEEVAEAEETAEAVTEETKAKDTAAEAEEDTPAKKEE